MDVKEPETYSFSKISMFHTCKYAYFLTYLKHLKGIDNCFALYGTLVHSIMERYAKSQLGLWDLPKIFEIEFADVVNMPFPESKYCKNMKELYFNQGFDFLSSFLGYDDYNILGVEENFEIKIDDWLLTGVIDLIYEDTDGKLIILDYKSKSKFKNKDEQQKYARQLYLYSIYIKDKYGRFPDKLIFWTFRKQKKIEIMFNYDEYLESLTWAKFTVNQIRNESSYLPSKDEFYCKNLCNHRLYCNELIKKGGKGYFCRKGTYSESEGQAKR